MKCAACGKDIENDSFSLVNGVGVTCPDCLAKIVRKSGRARVWRTVGGVVKALYTAAAVVLVGGFIAGAVRPALILYIWLCAYVSGMLLIALGKIIDLLEKGSAGV